MKRAAILVFALASSSALATGILNVLLGGYVAPLTSSASPTSVSISFPSSALSTAATTCVGHGGIVPFTYAWSWGSGGASISINSASSASTSFTVTGAAVNTTYSGTARCAVTDRRALSSPYANVSVSLSRIPLLPPSLGTATLVAGQSGTTIGYSSGGAPLGSLSSTIDYNGHVVGDLVCESPYLILNVTQSSSNASYITDLVINGTAHSGASATYTYNGTYGNWAWTLSCPFTNGGTYSIYYY